MSCEMCKVKLIECVDRGIEFIVDLLYYITSNLLLIMVSSVKHEHNPLELMNAISNQKHFASSPQKSPELFSLQCLLNLHILSSA